MPSSSIIKDTLAIDVSNQARTGSFSNWYQKENLRINILLFLYQVHSPCGCQIIEHYRNIIDQTQAVTMSQFILNRASEDKSYLPNLYSMSICCFFFIYIFVLSFVFLLHQQALEQIVNVDLLGGCNGYKLVLCIVICSGVMWLSVSFSGPSLTLLILILSRVSLWIFCSLE